MEPTWLTDKDPEAWKNRERGHCPAWLSPTPTLFLGPPSVVPVGTRLRLAGEIRTKEKERHPGPAHALSI